MTQFYRQALIAAITLVLLSTFTSCHGSKNSRIPSNGTKMQQQEKMRAIGESNLQFTNSLYQVLSKEPGNLFFSPLSIHSILSMAWLGAKGKTAQQLKNGLHLPQEQVTKDGYKSLNRLLNNGIKGNPTVNVANKIYVSKGVHIDPDYQRTANASFHSRVEGIDINNPAAAANTINQWVKDNTNNKIKDLVHPGMIGDSALLLVNAVYFKAQWNSVFSPETTYRNDFKITPDTKVQTMLMYAKTKFLYQRRDDLSCQLVDLNYVGNEISMVVILPNEVDGLTELEGKLATTGLTELINPKAFASKLTTVAIPKFKFEIPLSLNEPLKKMEMGEIFGDGADFSGMVRGNTKVRINNVAHKAFIEVNEEGTEAAGASFGGEPLMAPRPQEYFIADHPFIFLIHHKKSRNILFIGRFTAPPTRAETLDQDL